MLRKAQVSAFFAGGAETRRLLEYPDRVIRLQPERTEVDPGHIRELAAIPSRLEKLDGATQQRLINWGYAICDAAVRRMLDRTQTSPTSFPYPLEV